MHTQTAMAKPHSQHKRRTATQVVRLGDLREIRNGKAANIAHNGEATAKVYAQNGYAS